VAHLDFVSAFDDALLSEGLQLQIVWLRKKMNNTSDL
jgi:hypothetical protein